MFRALVSLGCQIFSQNEPNAAELPSVPLTAIPPPTPISTAHSEPETSNQAVSASSMLTNAGSVDVESAPLVPIASTSSHPASWINLEMYDSEEEIFGSQDVTLSDSEEEDLAPPTASSSGFTSPEPTLPCKRARTPAQRPEFESSDYKKRLKVAAKLAAHEYLMNKDTTQSIGFRKLAAKHGAHDHMAVKREVDRIIASGGDEVSNLKSIGDLIRAGTIQPLEDSESPGVTEVEVVDVADQDYFGSGVARPIYRKAMAKASLMVHKKQCDASEAVRWAERVHGAKLKLSTVRFNSIYRPGIEPERRGKGTVIPAHEESKLVCMVEMMRSMKICVYKDTLFSIANSAIKGTKYDKYFPNGVTQNWYYAWLDRYSDRLRVGHQHRLEQSRSKWTTSQNIAEHYEVLASLMIELKIAVINPDFDETVRFDKSR